MNKIFKVIWNKTLSAFVVTSELVRGQGKACTKTRHRTQKTLLFRLLPLSGILLSIWQSTALAATNLPQLGVDSNTEYTKYLFSGYYLYDYVTKAEFVADLNALEQALSNISGFDNPDAMNAYIALLKKSYDINEAITLFNQNDATIVNLDSTKKMKSKLF